jgi:hypothetical protein
MSLVQLDYRLEKIQHWERSRHLEKTQRLERIQRWERIRHLGKTQH